MKIHMLVRLDNVLWKLLKMTKIELLEKHIYYPSKRDKTINLYLSLGFYVLLYDLIGKTPILLKYDPNANMT